MKYWSVKSFIRYTTVNPSTTPKCVNDLIWAVSTSSPAWPWVVTQRASRYLDLTSRLLSTTEYCTNAHTAVLKPMITKMILQQTNIRSWHSNPCCFLQSIKYIMQWLSNIIPDGTEERRVTNSNDQLTLPRKYTMKHTRNADHSIYFQRYEIT